MRPRPVSFFVVVIALLAGVIWWLLRPPANAPTPEKVAEAPKAEVAKLSSSTPTPAATAPPVAMPVAKPAPIPAPGTTTAPDKNDPHRQLETLIPDIIARLQAGDINGFLEDTLAPDDLAKKSPEDIAQMQASVATPDGQQEIKDLVQALEALENQTPYYNDAGDQAAYLETEAWQHLRMTPPRDWKEVDGRWYENPYATNPPQPPRPPPRPVDPADPSSNPFEGAP